ncbi:MAG: NAD-dependent protein deacylase [Vicinamibacterales bacterium]
MTPVEELARRVVDAERLVVLTGAGLSAASGVPTFRGADGLWRQYRVADLATPEAFARDPRLVWEWYDWRRGMIRRARPNPGHEVLAAWAARPGVTLVTQNVDGLLERAGADPIRLHGSIWHLRCWRPCAAGRTAWRDETTPLATLPPPCPHCGGHARPDVTWFGEPLDRTSLEAAAQAAAGADVCLAVGTSAVVFPAASLLPLARQHGAWTAEINIEATDASGAVDLAVRGKSEEVLAEAQRIVAS